MWLPVDLEAPVELVMPNGVRAIAGSSARLLAELDRLNANTWQAASSQIARWREEGADFGAPLEKSAQFGFSVLHTLGTTAVEKRLPMKLDY